MQIKTTLRYQLTPIRMAKIQNMDDSLCWRGCEVKGNTPPLLVGVGICTAAVDISMAVSQKIRSQSTSRPSNTTFEYIPKRGTITAQE